MSITLKDLKKVYAATFAARNKWRNILLDLDVDSSTIDSISTKCRDIPDDCYREGLAEWLRGGDKSWSEVVEALSSPTVGYDDIAMMIEREYNIDVGGSPEPKRLKIEGHQHVINADEHHQKINKELLINMKENIGNGAFGIVFKGLYKNQPCAIKVLHHVAIEMQTDLPAGQGMKKINQAFHRECELLESFRHPNIVRHLSTTKHPKSDNTLLVTELLDCNLRSYISKVTELSSHGEVSLSKDVASGLAYIHSMNIIHRDLCGDNILLKVDQPIPVAKISDFGMARFIDPSRLSATLTAIGHRMGYLPPEAFRIPYENYDHTLDVFSLGVIMVQIIHRLDTIKTAEDRLMYAGKIPDSHFLKVIVIKCLQEDKDRRPTSKNVGFELAKQMSMADTMNCTPFGDKKRNKAKMAANNINRQNPPAKLPVVKFLRRGKDMPIKSWSDVRSVAIGEVVYVGGSTAGGSQDAGCTVIKYYFRQNLWTVLPQYKVDEFAMVCFLDQLVLIGGLDPTKSIIVDYIAMFDNTVNKWTFPYSPLNIARYDSTAISSNYSIVVAGGWINCEKKRIRSTAVEVFDLSSNMWFIADSLPIARSAAKSSMLGNTLYLMGGFDDIRSYRTVHKVVFKELFDKAVRERNNPGSPQTTLWQTVASTPLGRCAVLSIECYLLAIGGYDEQFRASSSIHLLQPDTMDWVKVGDLPTAQHGSTCSVLSNGEFIVIGGYGVSRVDFMSILLQD